MGSISYPLPPAKIKGRGLFAASLRIRCFYARFTQAEFNFSGRVTAVRVKLKNKELVFFFIASRVAKDSRLVKLT